MNASETPLISFPLRKRLQLYWVQRQWVDFALAVVVVVTWYLATSFCWGSAERCTWPQLLTAVAPEARRTIYQIIAAAAVTMGGFTLTSVSILVNLLRTPMSTIDRLLPAEDKSRVGSVFLGVLPWLLILFLTALVSLSTDANVPQGYLWLQLVLCGVVVATVLALARVVWVLRRLLSVSTE